MHPDAIALAQAARQLRESARTHKRSERTHRRQARECMQALDQLQRECAAHGIALELDDDGTAQEAQPR